MSTTDLVPDYHAHQLRALRPSAEIVNDTDSDDEPPKSRRTTRRQRHDEDEYVPKAKKPAKKAKKNPDSMTMTLKFSTLKKILAQNAEILNQVSEFRKEAKAVFVQLNLKK